MKNLITHQKVNGLPSVDQSHYRKVPRWEIFIEQELRFGLDLGHLTLLKKIIWTDYEQLLRPVFHVFMG